MASRQQRDELADLDQEKPVKPPTPDGSDGDNGQDSPQDDALDAFGDEAADLFDGQEPTETRLATLSADERFRLGVDQASSPVASQETQFLTRLISNVEQGIKTLKPEDAAAVPGLIKDLGSDRFATREAATQKLAGFGLSVLPLLKESMNHPSLEVRKRLGSIAQELIGNQLTKLGIAPGNDNVRLGNDFRAGDPRQGNVPADVIQGAERRVAQLDRLASNPEHAKRQQEFLAALSKLAEGFPEASEMVQNRQTGAGSIDRQLADARINLANLHVQNRDDLRATQVLKDAMAANPRIVKSGTFQIATVRAGAYQDENFMGMFRGMGGDATKLEQFAALRASMNEEPKPLGTMFNNFGVDVTSRQTATSRNAVKYLDSKKPEEKAEIMAAIEKDAATGDLEAKTASENLAVLDMLNQGINMLYNMSAMRGDVGPEARLEAIHEQMKVPPYQREGTHHKTIALILDHYFFANTDTERKQAMDLLRTDAQNGNLSALHPLKILSVVDAGLRLAEAGKTLQNPDATPQERQSAEQKKQEALKDLARHEYAERKNKEPGSAGTYLDHLAQRPALGVNPKDIEQARKDVEVEAKQARRNLTEKLRLATAGGSDGEGVARELKRIAGEQLSGGGGTEFNDLAHKATLAGIAHDVMSNLDSPDDLAHSLSKLGDLAQVHQETRQVLGALDDIGNKGKELHDAILSGNQHAVKRLATDPEVQQQVSKLFKPMSDLSEKIRNLRGENLLDALKNPENLERLLGEAKKEDQDRHRRVDDLVSDFLLRDGTSADLSRKLKEVAGGGEAPIKLDPAKHSALLSQLQTAVDQNLLPKGAVKDVKSLLAGEALSADKVKELAGTLELPEAQRRRQSLEQINQISRDSLHLSPDFENSVKQLEALGALQNTNESVKKALEVLASGTVSEQQKQDALKVVVDDLKELKRQSDTNVHEPSRTALHNFESAGGPKLDQMIKDLQSGDKDVAQKTLALMRDKLSDGRDQLNEFRALRIVRDLSPSASLADYRNALDKLNQEARDSKDSEGQPNNYALEWKKWAISQEAVASISHASLKSDSNAAHTAINTLVKEAGENNPYARAALAAVLVGDQPGAQIGDWLGNHPRVGGDKPVYVPDLREMKASLRADLIVKSTDALLRASQTGKLTVEETSAVALALSQASEGGKSPELTAKLTQILENGLKGQSRDEVVAGVYEAISSQPKGSHVLADIYLKGIDSPKVAEHFAHLSELASNHDQASLTIMAGLAAGMGDSNDTLNPKYKKFDTGKELILEKDAVSARARKVMENVAQEPEMREKVIGALLHVHELGKTDKRFADNNQMLSTLGSIGRDAQSPDELAKVRTALQEGYRSSAKDAEGNGHRSAVDGMFAMSKHWQKDDNDLITSRMSDQVVQGFQKHSDEFSKSIRDAALESLSAKINGGSEVDFKTRFNSVKAFSAFGKYLDAGQVEMLKAFGGDYRYNTGDGTNGLDRLKQLGIQGEDAKRFQAAVAESLLRVLATASSAAEGKGPRELAYDAFKNVPWPMVVTDPLNPGKEKIIGSRDSIPLKDALLNYFDGKPFNPELAQEINRIVDNAKLPRPAAAILQNLGVTGTEHSKWKPGDPPTVFQLADTIKEKYKTGTENGDQALRRIVENMHTVNALPPVDRAKVMGWDKLTDKQKEGLGWVSEPNAKEKARLEWDLLSEADRDNIRWSNAKVSGSQMIGQMFNGHLAETDNRALLTDIPQAVKQLQQQRAEAIGAAKSELERLTSDKRHLLGEYVQKTSKGASFGNQIEGLFTGNNGRDSVLRAEQTRLLEAIREKSSQIEARNAQKDILVQSRGGMELAVEVRKYHQLLNNGDQTGADKQAMKLWKEHGPLLSQLAGEVWNDLTVSKDRTLQGESMMSRLAHRQQAHWDSIPGYTSSPGKPYSQKLAMEGFREALGLKEAASTIEAGKAEKRGLLQLGNNEQMLDTEALRAHMMGRLNHDATLYKFSRTSRLMGDDLNDLSKMFSAAARGSVYEDSIADMKTKAEKLKAAMEKVSVEDLRQLEARIDTMEAALKEMKDQRDRHDPKTIEELEKSIDVYKGMHNLFNKYDSRSRYPEVMAQKTDEKGNPIQQGKQVDDMLKRILDGGLTASTFTNWCKENAVLIGVTIAACAATVAACATFGVTSPAAVGLWVAVAGLAAREVTNETFYHINKDGYTGWGNFDNKGAKVGHWARQTADGKFNSVEDALKHLGTDVVGPYALEIARDWAAFVITAGLMNGVFGGMPSKEAAASIFKAVPANARTLAYQSERMLLAAEKQGVAGSFARQFMREFGRELAINSGFTGVHLSAETGVHHAIGRENVHKMGEWGQFGLSFALSTTLALGQGALHSAAWKPGNKLSFKLAEGVSEAQFIQLMQKQGFDIRPTTPGKWEVRPVGATPNLAPIEIENAARGSGRPPGEVAPEGHTPSKQAREPLAENLEAGGKKWSQTPEGKEINRQIGEFTERFMKGDYDGALSIVNDAKTLAKNSGLEGVPREFDLQAYKAASPQERAVMLCDFMEHSMTGIGRVRESGGEAIGQVPKVEVTIDGIKFDLASGKPVDKPQPGTEGKHAAAQKTFDEFRVGKDGQRLLAEQALTTMEERLHVLQKANGDKVISPSYIKFIRDRANPTLEQSTSVDGSGQRTKATVEQEAILALHDNGWSVEMLKHHFGSHHAETRASVFKWLEGQQAMRNIADPVSRCKMEALVQSTAPIAREGLIERMPELFKTTPPESLPKVIDALAQVREAAGSSDLNALSVKLKELAARSDLPKDFLRDPVAAEYLAKVIEAKRTNLEKATASLRENFEQTLKDIGLSAEHIAQISGAMQPPAPVYSQADIDKAKIHITRKDELAKSILKDHAVRESAGRATDTLNELLAQGKVHPDTAMDIADVMSTIAQDKSALTPHMVRELSKLKPGQLMELPKSQRNLLLKSLQYKMIDGDAIVKGLGNPTEFTAALERNIPTLDALNSLSKMQANRAPEMLEELAQLPPEQIQALSDLYRNQRISDASFRDTTDLISGKAKDSSLSKLISPEEAKALISDPVKGAKVFEALALSDSLQQASGFSRNPQLVRSILTMEPGTARNMAEVLGNPAVKSEYVAKFIESIKTFDTRTAAIASLEFANLSKNADRYADLADTIFSEQSPQTFKALLDLAANTTVDKTALGEIGAFRNSDPAHAQLIDAALHRHDQAPGKQPLPPITRLETILAVKNARLALDEAGILANRLQSQQFSHADAQRFAKLEVNGRKLANQLLDAPELSITKDNIFNAAEAPNAKPVDTPKLNSLIGKLNVADQKLVKDYLAKTNDTGATINQRLQSLEHLEQFLSSKKHTFNQEHIGKITKNSVETNGAQLEYFAQHLPELLSNVKFDGNRILLASSPEILELGTGGSEKLQAIRDKMNAEGISGAKEIEEAMAILMAEKPIMSVMVDKMSIAVQRGQLGYVGGTNNESGIQMRGTLGQAAYTESGQLRAVFDMENTPYYMRALSNGKFGGVIEFGSNGKAAATIPLSQVRRIGWFLILE